MRRLGLLSAAGLGVWLALGAGIALAQDVRGVSFRATEAMPPGTDRGTADILATDSGEFEIHADFTRVAESLVLDDFEDAEAWVIWAVDGEGNEVNVGSLNEDLVLEGAAVDFPPARLQMSAEPSADVASRTGDALFVVVIRNVPQQAQTTSATATAAPTVAPTEAATDDDDAADDEEPSNLPTTGTPLRDMGVLVVVALVLLAGGWRLRRGVL